MEAMIKRLSADRNADCAAWQAIRAICCRTGDNGDPIAGERCDFFARLWIEPYEKLVPEWTYVAISGGGVVGYLTGCPNTSQFTRSKFWRADLPLLVQIACGGHRGAADAPAFIRRALRLAQPVEARFSEALRRRLSRLYPAHLHLNVEVEFRRAGLGRLLIENYLADLRRSGVGGVHLFCGAAPLAFYRRLDFQVLESLRLRDSEVFAMGRSL
jgi:GNAT superfamily N-acetyltransferase